MKVKFAVSMFIILGTKTARRKSQPIAVCNGHEAEALPGKTGNASLRVTVYQSYRSSLSLVGLVG